MYNYTHFFSILFLKTDSKEDLKQQSFTSHEHKENVWGSMQLPAPTPGKELPASLWTTFFLNFLFTPILLPWVCCHGPTQHCSSIFFRDREALGHGYQVLDSYPLLPVVSPSLPGIRTLTVAMWWLLTVEVSVSPSIIGSAQDEYVEYLICSCFGDMLICLCLSLWCFPLLSVGDAVPSCT